ncbi:hypothetical protein SAMN05421788_11235 [Filimonas lacunae]|uniref:Uncharacterized protein n=1 Tax=Filimonas lacunae TaxID=477680 RepID=A0A173MKV2_9BACT|nr:hypothetical protein [Filimonas lacunae]BAV08234.1 hypothetical protein FLA_4267 [Filimonas lacunae]SIT33125.1 hypothetical protein SAMN05421788_11235 [Filimonas lacunae]
MTMKLLLVMAFCTLTINSHAEYKAFTLYKGKTVASASAIVTRLCSEITITADQKTKVTEIISTFIDEKNKILPLQESNKAAYEEKRASYFKILKAKLSEVLLKVQLEKFLQLKPKVAETDNTLYYLFY